MISLLWCCATEWKQWEFLNHIHRGMKNQRRRLWHKDRCHPVRLWPKLCLYLHPFMLTLNTTPVRPLRPNRLGLNPDCNTHMHKFMHESQRNWWLKLLVMLHTWPSLCYSAIWVTGLHYHWHGEKKSQTQLRPVKSCFEIDSRTRVGKNSCGHFKTTKVKWSYSFV